uniref:MADF domain-containing protein n=2 Tax=Caenorhabditis japonica TaxID=281687 RepID=A0A8R1IM23_CAEJA
MNRALPEYSENHEESKTRKRTFAEGSRSTLGGSQQSYSPHSRLFTVDSSPLRRHTLPAKKDLKFDNLKVFIENIQQYPLIWDASEANYHRKEVHIKVYQIIEKNCRTFLKTENYNGRVAKKLWQVLLAKFNSYMGKLKRSEASGKPPKCHFLYADAMQFVKHSMEKRKVENVVIVGTKSSDFMENRHRRLSSANTSSFGMVFRSIYYIKYYQFNFLACCNKVARENSANTPGPLSNEKTTCGHTQLGFMNCVQFGKLM